MVLGVYGAGGLGREIAELANEINLINSTWEKIVFIDDSKKSEIIFDLEVYSFQEAISIFNARDLEFVIAIGEPEVRLALLNKIKSSGYQLVTIVHPTAKVSLKAILGKGTIVGFGTFISCNVLIGENVLLQPGALIGHDVVIKDNSIISSHVCIAGGCVIGHETYIGMNVPVRERINVGSKTVVGMGSVVQSDLPDEVIALGNPARAIRKNEEHRIFK